MTWWGWLLVGIGYLGIGVWHTRALYRRDGEWPPDDLVAACALPAVMGWPIWWAVLTLPSGIGPVWCGLGRLILWAPRRREKE